MRECWCKYSEPNLKSSDFIPQLQTEDLLINSSSGEPSLFTDAPVSVWIHSQQRHNNQHFPQRMIFKKKSPSVPKTTSC